MSLLSWLKKFNQIVTGSPCMHYVFMARLKLGGL